MSPSTRNPSRRVPSVDARRAAALVPFGKRPFTRPQALDAGLSLHDLRSDAVRPVTRGVFVAGSDQPTFATRCAGIALLLPEGGRMAGHAAAVLQGFLMPRHDLVTVSVPKGARFTRPEVVVQRHELDSDDSRSLWIPEAATHVPVTAPHALLRECARLLPLVDGMALADNVVNRSGVAAEKLLHEWRTSPDARIRQIAKLSASGSESAMESRTRVLLRLAGLPPPTAQFEVVVVGQRRRFDLAWPDYGVAVEYDGSHHYASAQQKHLDLLRDAECRAAGWEVVRIVSVGIYRDPADTVSRVSDALAARGCPVRLSDAWREHFPQIAR